MKINDVIFTVDLLDILTELRSQLALNGSPLLSHIKDTPDNVMVSCPYHKGGVENKPSAGIKKLDGTFHCFACGEVHSLQEVISFCFGRSDDMIGAFGWEWLLKNFVSISVENRQPIRLDLNRNKKSVTIDEERPTEKELQGYRQYHPYWKKRGITNEYVIKLFDLGYDKNTDCITFPIRDIYGNCLFVARRSVKTKFFNYPNGVTKPLYGLYEFYRHLAGGRSSAKLNIAPIISTLTGEVFICESMIDALTCWQYGRVALAMNGLGNELQMKQLQELPCRKLILATDNDSAGLKARKRIRHMIKNKIITEVLLPDGKKDLNECTEEEIKNLEEVF